MCRRMPPGVAGVPVTYHVGDGGTAATATNATELPTLIRPPGENGGARHRRGRRAAPAATAQPGGGGAGTGGTAAGAAAVGGGGGEGAARPALGLESFRAPRCGRLVTGDALRAVREISAPWAPTTESSAEA